MAPSDIITTSNGDTTTLAGGIARDGETGTHLFLVIVDSFAHLFLSRSPPSELWSGFVAGYHIVRLLFI